MPATQTSELDALWGEDASTLDTLWGDEQKPVVSEPIVGGISGDASQVAPEATSPIVPFSNPNPSEQEKALTGRLNFRADGSQISDNPFENLWHNADVSPVPHEPVLSDEQAGKLSRNLDVTQTQRLLSGIIGQENYDAIAGATAEKLQGLAAFFLSPKGVAVAASGGAGKVVQSLVAAGFAVQGGADLPRALAEVSTAEGVRDTASKIGDALLDTGMVLPALHMAGVGPRGAGGLLPGETPEAARQARATPLTVGETVGVDASAVPDTMPMTAAALKQVAPQTETSVPATSETAAVVQHPEAITPHEPTGEPPQIISTAVRHEGIFYAGSTWNAPHEGILTRNAVFSPAGEVIFPKDENRMFHVVDENGVRRVVDRAEAARIGELSGQTPEGIDRLTSQTVQPVGTVPKASEPVSEPPSTPSGETGSGAPVFEMTMHRGDPRETRLTPESNDAPGGIHYTENADYAEQYVRPEIGNQSSNPVITHSVRLEAPIDFRDWFKQQDQTVGGLKKWLESNGVPMDLPSNPGMGAPFKTVGDWIDKAGKAEEKLQGEGIDGGLNPNQDFLDYFNEGLKKLGKWDGVVFPEHGNGGDLTALVFKSKSLRPITEQPEPQTQPAPAGPKLRSGENQGDLLSTQTEDLKLVGEKGIDAVRIAEEKAAAEKASEEARMKQEKDQGDLFDEEAQARAAEAKYRQETLLDFEDQMQTSHAELLTTLDELGGLPTLSTKGREATGELKRVLEATPNSKRNLMRFFRKNALSLDDLRAQMNERGFSFETPYDMLSAIEARISSGRKQFGTRSTEPEFAKSSDQPKADPFERARAGDETAFDDLEDMAHAQRETEAPPDELGKTSGRNAVFTPEAFKRLFESAFAAKDFDLIHRTLTESDASVWKPLLKELFAKQATDPVAAAHAEWMRHIFNGTRPPDAKAAPTPPPPQATPPPRQPPPRAAQPPPPPPKPPKPPTPPPAPAEPRIAVDPIRGVLAKSPFQIIEDFSRAIGKALRIRKLKPSQLGVYRPGSTMTANRFAGDLDTAAHELAGHWVDDKHGIAAPWFKPRTRSPYDNELANFWIHGSITPKSTLRYKRAEGVAEFIRAYVMNPAEAAKVAPKFTAYFEKTAGADTLKAIRAFSQDVRTWAGENPVRRAALNVRIEQPTISERLLNAINGRGFGFRVSPFDRLRQMFDDSQHFAVKAFKDLLEIKGSGATVPSRAFEKTARFLNGFDSRFDNQLRHGFTSLRPELVKNAKGQLEPQRLTDPQTGEPMTLEWYLSPYDKSSPAAMNADMRKAAGMMVAERTIEIAANVDAKAQAEIDALDPADPATPRREQVIRAKAERDKQNVSGLGAGILGDVQAAQETMNALAAEPELAVRLKEGARRYRLLAEANIQNLVDSGRLSKDQAEAIRSQNTQYVDMHRLSEEFESANQAQRGGGIGTARDRIKRRKGSTLEIDNVFVNLIDQAESIQKEAFRNLAMRSFTDMLESTRQMHQGEAIDLDQIGSKASEKDANTIPVWKDGQATPWKFDKEIHGSLKAVGELGSHALIDALSAIPRFYKSLIIRGPSFLLRNPVRDTRQRAVITRTGSKVTDVLKGFTKAEQDRLEIYGGGNFGNYARTRNTWNRVMKDTVREMSKDPRNIFIKAGIAPARLAQMLWHGLEKIGHASETVGRIAEMRRAFDHAKKELGYNDYEASLEASFQARDLMDFSQLGTVMRPINQLVPFSGPRLRGVVRAVQAFKESPGKTSVRWGVNVLLPTVAFMLWNRSDKKTWDEYQQFPAYVRDLFNSVKLGNHWLHIPRPHELGVLAGGVERAISAALGDKHAFEGWPKSVASSTLPIGDPVEAAGPLKTAIELENNRNSFTNRDIIPFWERNLDLSKRKGQQYASVPGQGLAKMLNLSGLSIDARQMDHVLNSMGGIGSTLTSIRSGSNTKEVALRATGYVKTPPASDARDVQWVFDWAKKNGKENSGEIKAIKDLRKAYFEARSPAESDETARELREAATELRKQLEE